MTTPSTAMVRLDQEADGVVAGLGQYAIATDEDYRLAGEYLVDVATALKSIETEKKAITAPLRAALEATSDFFNKVAVKYKTVDVHLRKRMLDYSAVQRESELKALAAFAEGKVSAESIVLLATESAPTAAGVSSRSRMTWVTEDLAAVPREYLCLDEKKIGAAVRSGVTIPGIRSQKIKTLAVTAKGQ